MVARPSSMASPESIRGIAARGPDPRSTGFIPNPKAKLRDQVLEAMRFFHYSRRTEEAYWGWITRFLKFHRTSSTSTRRAGVSGVWLPEALARKYPQGPVEWAWFWVFPARSLGREELLGHQDVATTQIYTHVMENPGLGVRSPLDG